MGLVHQARLIACDADCTVAECCQTAAGDPLPDTRPAHVPSNQEVAQFGFVCEGISLPAMSDNLKNDFKDEICDLFLSTANPAMCTCDLMPGSVKAKVTLTAPADQSLGDLRTPTPQVVLKAVKSLRDITTAQEGTKEIGVAAVSGVVFKLNQTEAEIVAPMTTPSPPSPLWLPPTTTDDDGDSNVDASSRCVAMVALTVVVSITLIN
jgi:hypothetical protein